MTSNEDHESVFTCQMCGDCCRGYGGTYVSESDIQAIAEFVHEDPDTFKAQYCQLSGKRYVLAQAPNGYCVFWDALCRIHPVKPRMCRNWPYIQAVLKDVDNWHAMRNSCPGIRTDVPDEMVRNAVKRHMKQQRQEERTREKNPDSENDA
jgi:Fe-S-cluster containining protein